MWKTVPQSLWFKLTIAFAVVAVVAVGTVAVLANLAMTREMERYLVESGRARAERLQGIFLDYYEERGGWAGVEHHPAFRLPQLPPLQPGQPKPLPPDRVILTDSEGRVLADSFRHELRGKHIAPADLERAVPVEVESQVVGYVLVDPPPAIAQKWPPLAEQYLGQVNQALVWTSLVTLLVTVALGVLLSRQISAPLRRLSQAARGIAAGDLSHRAGVRGGGEVGELGRAFDGMAGALARQEELRQHLVADIAHELRTPLTVLRGNVEALLDGVREPTPANLVAIHEETLLLARLVNDLRDLALVEAGQLTLERVSLDLGELTRRVVARLEPRSIEAGLTLRLEAPPGEFPVQGDPDRLAQVLHNLLANALQYTPAGGAVTVTLARPDAHHLAVQVTDTGIGIPPADLPYVFERFYRADPSRARTRWAGGAGIGLTVVKSLVEAHGGRVELASPPPGQGRGTQFTITLPAR